MSFALAFFEPGAPLMLLDCFASTTDRPEKKHALELKTLLVGLVSKDFYFLTKN